jgi:hypothetical protein
VYKTKSKSGFGAEAPVRVLAESILDIKNGFAEIFGKPILLLQNN